ncbi:MAG: DUF3827 domain-containing protein [Lachnospiraceae bacterium]|nr:DUF3827 domain-containing protein [Lachnospiraceae bacterium]
MKKLFVAIPVFLFCILGIFAFRTRAAEIAIDVDSETAYCGDIDDGGYMTTTWFDEGTEITISAEEVIDGIYIKWESIPKPWTLTAGDASISAGQNGFLHEYVKVAKGTKSVTIHIPEGGAEIAEVYGFSAGELPDYVQIWEPPYDKADLLVFTAHSDDEVLYMGPSIVNLTNNNTARVQVAYMSDQYLTEPFRNHELLDGLWEMGVTHYPQLGKFVDLYSESLEEAQGHNDIEEVKAYVVETIRRFKPQIVVTHDLNGEYGHGMHRMIAKAVADTADLTGDASQYADSAQKYGAWDVPKTYLHLYGENKIVLPTREPLSSFGGRTALQVCKDAFEKHVSQQGPTFWVDDGYDDDGNPNDYQYSCAAYGLYRTTVGTDTGNSMLENLVTYDEQERQAQEATQTEPEPTTQEKPDKKNEGSGKLLWIIIAILVVLIIIVVLIMVLRAKAAKEKKRKQQQAARRQQQARQTQQRTPQQRPQQRNQQTRSQRRSVDRQNDPNRRRDDRSSR